MDNLEKFIRENRADLDKYDPPKKTWKRIKTGLKNRRTTIPVWFSAAASVVLIMGTAAIMYSIYHNKNRKSTMSNSQLPGLKETEIYYNTLFNSLYLEARPLLTGQPEIASELNSDMAQLDSICTDLKKDLKDNIANQEVIEAMIQNYRIKLQLLEDMLKLLKENENKSENTQSHEL